MGRSGGRGGNKRFRRGTKRKSQKVGANLTKKQKQHFRQYGDVHPAECDEDGDRIRYRTMADEAPADMWQQRKVRKRDATVSSTITLLNHGDSPGSDAESSSDIQENPLQELMANLKHGCDEIEDDDENSVPDDDDDDKNLELEDDGQDDDQSSDVQDDDDHQSSELDDDDDVTRNSDSALDESGNEDEARQNLRDQDEKDADDDDKDNEEDDEESLEEEVDEHDQSQLEPMDRDPFSRHFETVLPQSTIDVLALKDRWQTEELKLPKLGHLKSTFLVSPSSGQGRLTNPAVDDMDKLFIKQQLQPGWRRQNQKHFADPEPSAAEEGGHHPNFTHLQRELMSVVGSYVDLLCYGRTHANGEEIRDLYCLHALNHVLKTRIKVIHHNSKLARRDEAHEEEYRDQGLTRPKVLIWVPFRESALRVVKALMSILTTDDDRVDIVNKKRFLDDFGDVSTTAAKPSSRRAPKPPDHSATFAGNSGDHFRLGISVTKKSLRLYADFYSSDILIASPLGLRMLVGAEGEKDRDYDFLSSLELLIVDQADVMLMQNWDHVLHCMSHLHRQPKEAHGVDFSRVRMWTLNGWQKFYRQTLCFTSFVSPEVNGLFSRFCCNYDGIVRTVNPIIGGTIRQVAVQLPQVFQRFQVTSLREDASVRFQFFITKVLPQFKEAVMSHTLIFVPSYFDFVRLRNHFRKEDVSFAQICEYHETGKVAQARDWFCHGKRKFLLYTERAHFYNRYRIKGIRHLVFYQLPSFPHFYSELCNFTHLTSTKSVGAVAPGGHHQTYTCTVVFSRYDAHRLAAVVGTERTSQMLASDKDVHLLVTGES